MARIFELKTYIDLGVCGEDAEVKVQFTYSPGTPDVWYLSNGDPGYPGDPPEINIIDILWAPDKNQLVSLVNLIQDEDEMACLEEKCLDYATEHDNDDDPRSEYDPNEE